VPGHGAGRSGFGGGFGGFCGELDGEFGGFNGQVGEFGVESGGLSGESSGFGGGLRGLRRFNGPGGMCHPPGPVRHPRGLWQRNPWPAQPVKPLAGTRADPRPPCKRHLTRPAQSARPGARPHIPGAHSRPCACRTPEPPTRHVPATRHPAPAQGRHRVRTPPAHWLIWDWFPAIRHKALNGRDAANYAGCTRFAPVRAARVSGACTAPAVKRRSRWLNRAPGEGDPRSPCHHQAGRPAPSGITR
jgi:hypothetical protein